MGITFIESSFRPGEIRHLTGLSLVHQTKLRERGHLGPKNGGWARYSVQDAARLLAIAKLSLLGIGPTTGTSLFDKASAAATHIIRFAYNIPGAIYDPNNLAKGERPLSFFPENMTRRYLIAYGTDGEGLAFAREGELDQLFKLTGENLCAAIVLDLKRIAVDFAVGAGKPLVTVMESN